MPTLMKRLFHHKDVKNETTTGARATTDGPAAQDSSEAGCRSVNIQRLNAGLAWPAREANIKREVNRLGIRRGDTIRVEDVWGGTREGVFARVVPDTGSIDFDSGYGPRGDDIVFIEKVQSGAPAEAASAAEGAQVATPRKVCGSCGTGVLTTDEFVEQARSAGYAVDPLTGDATSGPGQAVFDTIEARRGYECRSCGKVHCTTCLMSTPQHPTTRGPRCPSCSEGPHRPLE